MQTVIVIVTFRTAKKTICKRAVLDGSAECETQSTNSLPFIRHIHMGSLRYVQGAFAPYAPWKRQKWTVSQEKLEMLE